MDKNYFFSLLVLVIPTVKKPFFLENIKIHNFFSCSTRYRHIERDSPSPFFFHFSIFSDMGANVSSIDTNCDDGLNYLPFKPKLDDIPEACVALLLSYLDPPEICKLSRINRLFRAASSADFIWEPKLPSNYNYILQKLLALNVDDALCKKDIFAKLSSPRSFDGDTKVCLFSSSSFFFNILYYLFPCQV